ncbi:hypothetical protein M2427_007774 [Bradyrhizobium sp. BR13661]|jgi:hypothetical protein|nr:hypothetical protein [Bradyrhizobium sp. BR13661]
MMVAVFERSRELNMEHRSANWYRYAIVNIICAACVVVGTEPQDRRDAIAASPLPPP